MHSFGGLFVRVCSPRNYLSLFSFLLQGLPSYGSPTSMMARPPCGLQRAEPRDVESEAYMMADLYRKGGTCLGPGTLKLQLWDLQPSSCSNVEVKPKRLLNQAWTTPRAARKPSSRRDVCLRADVLGRADGGLACRL